MVLLSPSAQILNPQLAAWQLLDTDVVLGNIQVVLNDAARRLVAARAAAEFDRARGMFELLLFTFVADVKLKHRGSCYTPIRPGRRGPMDFIMKQPGRQYYVWERRSDREKGLSA